LILAARREESAAGWESGRVIASEPGGAVVRKRGRVFVSDVPIDLLAGRKFPEIASAVRAASDKIVLAWTALSRQALPTAEELTFADLRDNLPGVLEQIAQALESDQTPQSRFIGDMTAEHGVQRFDINFNLSELLQEYAILRPVVFREVAAALGKPLSMDELNALNVGLDISVRRAVVAFVEHQSRQLQSASEAQSKYLSFLSHDLRGGLNGVFLMIEVLKRELQGEERLKETVVDLDAMRRSLMDTVGTMDRFLHAERFRKGKVPLKPAPLSIRALVDEVIAHFAYQAEDKGLQLQSHVPGDFTVVTDRELLTLVLQNIVSNAVKYTGKGSILIGGQCGSDDGCILWVRDEGPGIAPEKLDELFTAYSRGETHGQPGVGLGLNIAHQAAQYLGAKLRAESTVGKGSTFYLELPRELKGF
jgi:signal transduction histidine kinase